MLSIRQLRRKKYPDLPAPMFKLELPQIPNVLQSILKDQKGCRNIYQQLMYQNNETPTSHAKWENELGDEEIPWQALHNLPFKCCLGTNTKWFQFRILHRILATNTFLHKIGLKDSNLCAFCNIEPETLSHLFYCCPFVNSFWNNLSQWLTDSCENMNILNLTKAEVLLGIINKNRGDLTVNFILLCAKQFIYKCKNSMTVPRIENFKPWLHSIYKVEKYIAYKDCKWVKFNKRWSKYQRLFQQ